MAHLWQIELIGAAVNVSYIAHEALGGTGSNSQELCLELLAPAHVQADGQAEVSRVQALGQCRAAACRWRRRLTKS